MCYWICIVQEAYLLVVCKTMHQISLKNYNLLYRDMPASHR
jgi:hypothetical protein